MEGVESKLQKSLPAWDLSFRSQRRQAGDDQEIQKKAGDLNGNRSKLEPSFDSAAQRDNQCILNTISPSRKLRAPAVAAVLTICAVFADPKTSPAASATWSTNPPSGDWNSASNWVPMTVPNGPNANATFQTSNRTLVSLSADTEVNAIIFNSGASPFYIVNGTAITVTISGTGVTNSSGITQSFFISGHMAFTNASRAGDFTSFILPTTTSNHATITFSNSATAGSATFLNYPGSIMSFSNSSTAESANVTLLGGGNPESATQAVFANSSSAANALFTINGGQPSNGGLGATLEFFNTSRAGAGTFITNGGVGGGGPGMTMTATLIANSASSMAQAGYGICEGLRQW
jgi:hypothetical protein